MCIHMPVPPPLGTMLSLHKFETEEGKGKMDILQQVGSSGRNSKSDSYCRGWIRFRRVPNKV